MNAREVSCTHCGLPVPAALVEEGAERQFCCEGCRTVFAVIHEHGLDGYYNLAREAEAQQPRVTGRAYEEFDDPAFFALYCRRLDDSLAETELYLEGVHCAACVWLVEKVPQVMEGVLEVRLDLGRSRARVRWDPRRLSLSRVAGLLDSLGYPVHPYRASAAEERARREDRRFLLRLGITGAVAGNVMLIAFALYGGMFHGMAREYETFFRWVSLLLTLPAVIWGGGVFFRGAWGAWRTRTLHMDLPISIGIAAGFGWGALNTIRGTGEVYFESVTALIFLLLAGRFIQRRRQRAAADAAGLLFSLAPRTARVLDTLDEGAVGREVPVEALTPGSLVEVRAGETVPADGVVVEGASALDLALLTGESQPAPIAVGDEVFAGTLNLGSRLVVRVERTGEQTRVGQLMAMVEEFSRRKAPIVQMADRLSGVFTATVLFLAGVTVVLWWWWHPENPSAAIEHAVALLIVSCPCALGLATPLAVSAAIGSAARRGILLRGADIIERLARPGRIWLDKTGTLTEGRMQVLRWWGDRSIGPAVAAIERGSSHPVALALAEAFEASGEASIEAVEQVLGSGMRARLAGRPVAIGSPSFIAGEIGRPLEAAERRQVEAAIGEGLTPVLVAWDGVVVAGAGLGDPIRRDARAALEALEQRGWRVGLLSGDHPVLVRQVGRQLGLPEDVCRGGMLPEQKLAVIESDPRPERVVMVGDGVNDAAALAAAGVGIAVHSGAEAAMAAADVYLSREGVAPLVEVVDGARRTLGVIRTGLVFSLLYNLVAAALAMAGQINPLVAAILMPASSLTVITLAYRARTFPAPGPAGKVPGLP
ncbi:MAG: heavy metal translocating P-type ATPase [Acidobacteriota bacterium]|nr:heavy metal translocating P-type ATPase [Acidobacteriota bacterium]MDQ7086674.1 heavy metal translocating P-type ATPase [Acidobacteriota bacterium]